MHVANADEKSGRQDFAWRTKIFNTIAENFCPRIKFFGGTIF